MQTDSTILTRCAAYAIVVLLLLSFPLTANVTLAMSPDKVFLSDGSVLKCTLLCRGKESVVVLVGDRERTLSASTVLRIERGQLAGERKSFKTEPVAGHEQITGIAEENVAPKPAVEPASKKPHRATHGASPFGGRAGRKQKNANRKKTNVENKTAKTLPRLPANLDTERVRKLINEMKTGDIIKAIENLKKKFGTGKN